MELWPTDAEEIALLKESVDEAARIAVNQLKEQVRDGKLGKKRGRDGRGGRDDHDRDDDVVEAGLPKTKRSKRH